MFVVLFGAGASAGAGSILPERPPLGAQLYGNLRRFCPGTWGAVPEPYSSMLEADFEVGMGALSRDHSIEVPSLMRDMAVYFVQFRSVGRASLYDRLVAELQSRGHIHDCIFSTLNYDCILEYSLAEAGFAIDYFGYPSATSVPVLKLHGSCNMFSARIQASPGITYTQGVVFEGGIRAWLNPSRVIEHCLKEAALAPVMCQYMEGKPTSVSPSGIKQIQGRWKAEVAEAEAVYCVGVRPHWMDGHIWKPLAATAGEIFFIGDRSGFEEWTQIHRPRRATWLAATFDAGYQEMLSRLEAA